VLAAAFARAGHVALIGRLTTHRAVRPLQLTTVQLLTGTVLFAVPAAPLATTVARLGTNGWLAVAYLALFCSVLAFLIQTIAVQRTSASRASLLLGTEPVWAVVAGICLGGESLTVAASIGAALVVGGAYWGQAIEGRLRDGRRRPASSAHPHAAALAARTPNSRTPRGRRRGPPPGRPQNPARHGATAGLPDG
jgi:drug/metabolite transporter (DMT)-like permease